MQSNLSQPQAPVYDNSPEFDDYNDRFYDDYYHEEEVFYPDEGEHDTYYVVETDGKQRVAWLLLIVLIVIVVAGVLIFGVIPYLETFTQGNPPPLPPAVQT